MEAIDQDVAFGSRDEESPQFFGADEVHVTNDLVRRERLVPVGRAFGLRGFGLRGRGLRSCGLRPRVLSTRSLGRG